MTPDFNDFLSYVSEHIPEMQYDTSQKLRAETGFTLSQADIDVVSDFFSNGVLSPAAVSRLAAFKVVSTARAMPLETAARSSSSDITFLQFLFLNIFVLLP